MKNINYLIIDSSENNSDLYYKTEFFVPDAVLFIESKGRKTLILNDLEYERGKSESKAEEVLSYSEFVKILKKKGVKNINILDVVDLVLRQKRLKTLEVQKRFPVYFADGLRKRGYRVKVSKRSMFYPERLVKSDYEIKKLKKSLKKTVEAMDLAINVIAKSKIKNNKLYYKGTVLTSERVKSFINSFLAGHEYIASHTIVAGGSDSWMPHNTGSGQLFAHKPIIIDIFPKSQATGYYGDMTRTVVKGKPSSELINMYNTVLEGQKLGLKMIKHGVKAKSIHKSIVETFNKRGFKTGEINGKMQGFIHSTGHGLGLDIHEPPRISLNNETLIKGNVLTVEPGLYYEKLGGIRIEDSVMVTDNGCINLTKYKKQFIV